MLGSRAVTSSPSFARARSASALALTVSMATAPLVTTGCATSGNLRPVLMTQPTELAKCKVGASQSSPLVTEWPASEKANLEARLREGGVVVAYSGCTMRLLPACQVKGSYSFRRTTTSTDTVEVRDVDELYAKLPLGAASLEGELGRTGRIAVRTTIAGQLALTGLSAKEVPETGGCSGATHLISALSVGAFKLESGGVVTARAEASVMGLGGPAAKSRSEASLVSAAGDPEACNKSTDAAADPQCASPIQVFLQPLPSQLAKSGPAGTVHVRFLGAEPERRWQVVSNDAVLCTTPCDRWVEPTAPLVLRSEGGFFNKNVVAMPPIVREPSPGVPIDVQIYESSFLRLGGGTTLTTLGGLTFLGSIALISVGFAKQTDNPDGSSSPGGTTTPGFVLAPISLAMLIPGIYLLARSGARAEVASPSAFLERRWVAGPQGVGLSF